jgi:short subunit dehydrogenase-like uncharacterized protein
MAKKYDVILYGASGFTGKQTVEYFLKNAPTDLKWAVAGRNRTRLTAVLDEVVRDTRQVDILEADSADLTKIHDLVGSTRVILTTAGPYRLYGKNLLVSCAEQGVDYVDITGETAFVRDVMETHEEKAIQSGAKIIPFSGFDSIPSDLGVFAITEYLREKKNTKTVSVRGMFSMKGAFNGGTLLSMLDMFESGDWKKMTDPALLIRGKLEGVSIVPDSFEAVLDKTLNRWIAPFMMSMINTRVVNRSAHLFSQYGSAYGPKFSYTEHHNMSDWWNPAPAFLFSAGFKAFQSLGNLGPMRELLRKLGPGASEGPSVDAMDNGYFRLDGVGEGENGDRVQLEFSGKGDPGNRATVLFLCESALALATMRDRLPGGKSRSGFLTPSTGLGNALVQRLKNKNITINIKELEYKEREKQ